MYSDESKEKVKEWLEVVIRSNNYHVAKIYFDKHPDIFSETDHGIVHSILKKHREVRILKEVLSRLDPKLKSRVINGTGESGELTLFLALDAGDEYLKVFQAESRVNWTVFDNLGNNLLHNVFYSRISADMIRYLFKKIDVTEINDRCENVLHRAAAVGFCTFHSYVEDYGKHLCDRSVMKKLVNCTNLYRETPFLKLLKCDGRSFDCRIGGKAVDISFYNLLGEFGLDYLKSDDHEDNCVSYAVKNDNRELIKYFQSKEVYKEELQFSALENDRLHLLGEEFDREDGWVVGFIRNFIKTRPERSARFFANDVHVILELFEMGKLKHDDDLDGSGSNPLLLTVKHGNYYVATKLWKSAGSEQGESAVRYMIQNDKETLRYFSDSCLAESNWLDDFLSSEPGKELDVFLVNNKHTNNWEELGVESILEKAVFNVAKCGMTDQLKVILSHCQHLIYKLEYGKRSLLEIAVEQRHFDMAIYLVWQLQRKIEITDPKFKTPELTFEYFVNTLGDRPFDWAKDMVKILKDDPDFTAITVRNLLSLNLKHVRTLNQFVDQMEDKDTFDVKNYGRFKHYVWDLKIYNNRNGLRRNITPLRNVYSQLSHHNHGHTWITLVASRGCVEDWLEIEKIYREAFTMPWWKASDLDNLSIGSPIQAAMKAGNNSLLHYFLKSVDKFELASRYSELKDNVLHTTVKEDRIELFNDFFYKYKSRTGELMDALMTKNKKGDSPVGLALKLKKFGLVQRILSLVSENETHLNRMITWNKCELVQNAVRLDVEPIVDKIFDLENKYNRYIEEGSRRGNTKKLDLRDHMDKELSRRFKMG